MDTVYILKKMLKICIFEKKAVSLQVKSMFMKKVCFLLLAICACVGCTDFKQSRRNGVIAEYHGETITQVEIDALTANLSAEDSVRVAEQYIRQWATNLLVWEKAKSLNSKEIEKKVADYQRSLCLHEWEQRVVRQKMPQHVEDSMILAFYENNLSHFILRDPILKGLILIIPNGAPNMDKLRKYVTDPAKEENIEWIEKYAYQYATGYELFLEGWKTSDQLLQRIPIDKITFHKQLKQTKQIEIQDSINTYVLQVIDVYHAGDYKPLDYARSDIEKMLLSQRQVEFLRNMREELYHDAVQQGNLKIYEK